ncbi:hypothetical protein FPV67DRAFT_1657832 [Lyophyllum atratum]|nr:hypothetical protein FPV67DRAFT_1657832 [Lyophyllum atratum]
MKLSLAFVMVTLAHTALALPLSTSIQARSPAPLPQDLGALGSTIADVQDDLANMGIGRGKRDIQARSPAPLPQDITQTIADVQDDLANMGIGRGKRDIRAEFPPPPDQDLGPLGSTIADVQDDLANIIGRVKRDN